jgi:hypothetical protein
MESEVCSVGSHAWRWRRDNLATTIGEYVLLAEAGQCRLLPVETNNHAWRSSLELRFGIWISALEDVELL